MAQFVRYFECSPPNEAVAVVVAEVVVDDIVAGYVETDQAMRSAQACLASVRLPVASRISNLSAFHTAALDLRYDQCQILMVVLRNCDSHRSRSPQCLESLECLLFHRLAVFAVPVARLVTDVVVSFCLRQFEP